VKHLLLGFAGIAVPALLLSAQPAVPSGERAAVEPRAPQRYSGRDGNTTVQIPRFDAPITVDGTLDEPQWAAASQLTGFSQFNPSDGRPSIDSTVALVWYGPDAIYFAVRAYAPAGTVRGTLADRDRIQNDDHVQFILDTFNDRRQAFVFAVNPLGVQSDGIRTEGGGGGGGRGGRGGGGMGGGMGGGFSRANLGNADLNQDMIWQSRGQITDWGYQVEIRVPFKSIRYRVGRAMQWGLNVVRNTQRNNYQDTWTRTSRGQASFLVQSGRLEGIRDLRRGLVLDLTPVVTTSLPGSESTTGGWGYAAKPQYGGDVRWGITPNLTLNATVNPDFSQVEADVGQIPGDVRFALFFPELRPFFVEGNEQIDTPNQLVYTRRIIQPRAAAKATGKVSRFDLGVLSAIDNAKYSTSGFDSPIFNIARMRRDLGAQNNIGFTVTDRREGADFNTVLNADGRFLLRNVYTASYQMATSRSRTGSTPTRGDIWEFSFDRTGRSYGFRNSIEGVSAAFESRAGFVPRLDYVQPQMNQRYTYFGARGQLLEQAMIFLSGQGTWTYNGFFAAESPLETRVSLSTSLQLRGGWGVGITPSLERFGFQPERYATYAVEAPRGVRLDTLPFVVGASVPARQLQLRLTTPQFGKFGGSISSTFGRDAEFFETAQARRVDVNATLDLRPTPRLRISAIMLHQEFRRERDNSAILRTNIPRLRTEFQLNRAIFFRFVGQYESRLRDAYRDPRTELPILLRNSSGTYVKSTRSQTNAIRADWLFSYFPSPGKVVYLGYGASLNEAFAFRFREMDRSSDGFFVKVSWLYRVP
jgi:hypothetical protein